jgi:hypothetical protein
MKQVHVYAVIAALALAIIGCGGSGNDSSSTSGSTGGTPANTPVVEAVLAQDGVVPTDPATFVAQDPLNIQVEQQIAFQLVSYDTSGNRTVLPTSGWRSSDTASSYGSLADNSGLFVAGTRATTTTLYVGIRYAGTDYYAPYVIKPRQATVSGQIVDELTSKITKEVSIVFYDKDGFITGRVKQPYNGFFRGSVPLNSTTFTVDSDSLPNVPGKPLTYQRFFRYNGKTYATGDDFCRAPLPVLATGTNALATTIKLIPVKGEAAASADGCG